MSVMVNSVCRSGPRLNGCLLMSKKFWLVSSSVKLWCGYCPFYISYFQAFKLRLEITLHLQLQQENAEINI